MKNQLEATELQLQNDNICLKYLIFLFIFVVILNSRISVYNFNIYQSKTLGV